MHLGADVLNIKCVDFEEAILLTGHGKFHWLLLVASGLCLTSFIVEILNTSYLMPAAQCDFNLSSQDKGVLSAIGYIGMIASSYLWGYLADTRGRRSILIFSLLMDCLCTIASSLAPNFSAFLTMRFLNGFFICGPSAVSYAYLGEFHTAATRTKAIMLACVFIALGVCGLPCLAWLIIPLQFSVQLPWLRFVSWRLFTLLCGVPSLVTATLLGLCLPESPKYLMTMGRQDEAMKVLSGMYAANTGCSPELYPVETMLLDKAEDRQMGSSVLDNIWEQTAPLFRAPYLGNTLLACILQFGLFASFNGLLQWLPQLFNDLATFDSSQFGRSSTMCSVLSAPGRLSPNTSLELLGEVNHVALDRYVVDVGEVGCDASVNPLVFRNALVIGLATASAYIAVGLINGRISTKKILVSSLFLSGCVLAGLYWVSSAATILTLISTFTALCGLATSVLSGAVVAIFPTHLRAMALCLSLMMGRLGTALSSILLGALLQENCTLVLFLLVGIVIVCGFLCLLLPSPRHAAISNS